MFHFPIERNVVATLDWGCTRLPSPCCHQHSAPTTYFQPRGPALYAHTRHCPARKAPPRPAVGPQVGFEFKCSKVNCTVSQMPQPFQVFRGLPDPVGRLWSRAPLSPLPSAPAVPGPEVAPWAPGQRTHQGCSRVR